MKRASHFSDTNQCGVHVDGRHPAVIAWGISGVLKASEEAEQ